MCRLYARISVEPKNSLQDLSQAPFSLLKQSRANLKILQKDGWGILGLAGQEWRGFKSREACFDESKKFGQASEKIISPVILAHIRRASNPRKLPKSRLQRLVNSQPFFHKNLIFSHNLTLNIPH